MSQFGARTCLGLGASLTVLGFLGGYVPERSRRADAAMLAATRGAALDAAQAQLRVATLLGDVLATQDLAARSDFGQAQVQASAFFDAVRTEAQAPTTPAASALTQVLNSRDAVTAALTRSDPAVTLILGNIQRRLRAALGYAVPDVRAVQPQ